MDQKFAATILALNRAIPSWQWKIFDIGLYLPLGNTLELYCRIHYTLAQVQ